MSKEAFLKALHQLPDIMRAWLESIGPLEEVKHLVWENEILPDTPINGWKMWKVEKHRRVTVQVGDIQYVQVFVRSDEGRYEKAAPDAVCSFGPSLL